MCQFKRKKGQGGRKATVSLNARSIKAGKTVGPRNALDSFGH